MPLPHSQPLPLSRWEQKVPTRTPAWDIFRPCLRFRGLWRPLLSRGSGHGAGVGAALRASVPGPCSALQGRCCQFRGSQEGFRSHLGSTAPSPAQDQGTGAGSHPDTHIAARGIGLEACPSCPAGCPAGLLKAKSGGAASAGAGGAEPSALVSIAGETEAQGVRPCDAPAPFSPSPPRFGGAEQPHGPAERPGPSQPQGSPQQLQEASVQCTPVPPSCSTLGFPNTAALLSHCSITSTISPPKPTELGNRSDCPTVPRAPRAAPHQGMAKRHLGTPALQPRCPQRVGAAPAPTGPLRWSWWLGPPDLSPVGHSRG